MNKENLSQTLIEFAKSEGASAAGIVTLETLAGGPPSADLTYVMPEARSAVVFSIPLDQNQIVPFLKKEDRLSLERNVVLTNALASGISMSLANFLNLKGVPSVPVPANLRYRSEMPNGLFDLVPDISHRYLAVRAGIGHFGLSGNVITQMEGASVLLGCTITAAELEPTNPLPPEDNYCDGCGMCMASCASGFVDLREKVTVTLGGEVFTYAKRRDYHRCGYLCGGFTGLAASGKWSTWSPGRFPIPQEDGEFLPSMLKAMKNWTRWPDSEGGFYTPLLPWKIRMACAHCQLVCTPDKDERRRRHEMVVNAGVVVQNPDGSLEAVPPAVAEERLAAMPPEVRSLYENI